MVCRLKKHVHLLHAVKEASPKLQKAILCTSDDDFIKCLSECCHNICKGNIKLSEKEESELKKHCAAVRQLASRSVSLKRKRQVLQQKGSGLITAVVAPILASLLLTALNN